MRALEFMRDGDGRPIAIRIRIPEGGIRNWWRWAVDTIRERLPARRAAAVSARPNAAPEVKERWVLEPRNEALAARLRDVWKHRRLLRFFAAKSLSKLYQRTVLGATWIFVRPLFPLAVNTIVFGGVLGVGSSGVPYFLFINCGGALWDLFSQAVTWGTRSLELNRGFMSRIYLPRLILPMATMTPAYLNFALNLGVLAVALTYYRVTTGVLYWTPWHMGWALIALIQASILALGIALWTSVPGMQARDVRFTMSYVLGFWLFLTPVLYPLNVGPKYAWLLALNPMAAPVNAFKYGLLGIGSVSISEWLLSVLITVIVLLSGLWFFGRAEADAADKM
jgi:lipopolysaccharide transport system permease protein